MSRTDDLSCLRPFARSIVLLAALLPPKNSSGGPMRSRIAGIMAAAVLIPACAEQAPSPQDLEVPLYAVDSHNFGTHLTGAEEVPVNDSPAQGSLVAKLSADGSELDYQLMVANIENVTQAHIHCGPVGVNGPIVVWLYPSSPPAQLIEGTSNGVLNRGTARNADVIARPNSTACPGGVSTLADVVAKLRTGGAYANVHTVALPPGEIRGQIDERGPGS
jgi:hypothetical protein